MDVRLYIRDDGSSDRTTDILASYQEHKNVKIEKGNNLGFAKSFLTALDECDEADYYAFSDQDDVWEKDKLSTAIEILEEESQSTPLLYCSALQRVDENLNPLHVQSYHGLRINLPSMLTRGRLAGCTFVFNNTLRNLVKNSKEKEIDTKTQLLYNMQIISLSIALMTAFVPLINRVLYYGMAYELLYLPNMLKLINNRREKMLVKVFLILMYGGITAYGMINSGWYTCIPYNFYFDYR